MQIGPYEVLLELGRGGMGTVYLGRVVGAGSVERLVAIKRAHPQQMASDEGNKRFLNEGRLAACIHHANVVGVHQAGTDEQGHYLVCEYVEGESLAQLLERAPPSRKMPRSIVTRVVLDALAGLHAAHESVDADGAPLCLLHRDVSIENLLVGRDGITRLADFGLAKGVPHSVITEDGVIHGKLVYLAPEYLRRRPVDRTLDVYAMGVTLWIALAGDLPWRGMDGAQLLQAIVQEGMPPLSSAGVHVPAELERIVARACHREASQRFQTARDMLDALESLPRTAGGAASHVQVAEYVEEMVGPRLAARREQIRTRRDELDREARTIPMRLAELPGAQSAESVRGRFPSRRSLALAGALLTVLALGYALLAATEGPAMPATAPVPLTAAFAKGPTSMTVSSSVGVPDQAKEPGVGRGAKQALRAKARQAARIRAAKRRARALRLEASTHELAANPYR